MHKKSNLFLIFIKTFLLCLALTFLTLGIFFAWQFYQKTFQEIISLKKGKNIEVKEALELNFSVPVWNEEYAKKIKILPEEKATFEFNETGRKLIIRPEKFWQPGREYQIFLPEGRTAMLTKISKSRLTFSVFDFPQIKTVLPENGAKDVVLGAEDPIVIEFDHSTKDYFINFVLSPEGEVDYQNNTEKTQFKLLPKNKVQDGAVYSLKIFAKLIGEKDTSYKELYAGSFETLRTAPIAWEKNLELRLKQSKKYTKAKIAEGKYVDINLSTQIMTIFENGTLLDSFLISSGKKGMETSVGQTQVYNKAPRPYSKAYGLYMPFWMALASDGKWGIHELPEWPGGYKEGVNHLGIPVSHGCVRLGVGSAKTVYDWVEIGTPVIVY